MAERFIEPERMMIEEACRRGLRPDLNNQTNRPYLKECVGVIPTTWGLVEPDAITKPSGLSALTVNFPFPQISRGDQITILADETDLYEIDEDPTNWSDSAMTAYDATAPASPYTIQSGNVWDFESFDTLLFMTNGASFLFKAPHIHATKLLGHHSTFLVNTLAKHNNRLVLGGLTGSVFAGANWLEIFEVWRRTTGGQTTTSTATAFDDGYILWSEEGGGAEDSPFATLLACLQLPDAATYTKLKPILFNLIETGQMGLLKLDVPGAVNSIRTLGKDLIMFQDNQVSRLIPRQDGFDKEVISSVGVSARTAVGGDKHELVYVDNQGVLRRLREGDREAERLGYEEFLAPLVDASIAVAYDPDEGRYLISDGVKGYWYTNRRGSQDGGLAETRTVAPSLLRDDLHNLVGYPIPITNPSAEHVTNGVFAADTDWTKGANWAIAAGVASHSAGSTATIKQVFGDQAIELSDDVRYYVSFDIASRTAGSIVARLGDDGNAYSVGESRTIDGTYQEELRVDKTATNPHDIIFTPSTDFDGDIDNVTVFIEYPDIRIRTDRLDPSTREVAELVNVKTSARDTSPNGWLLRIFHRLISADDFTQFFHGSFDIRGHARPKVTCIDCEIELSADAPTAPKIERIEGEWVVNEQMGKQSLNKILNP